MRNTGIDDEMELYPKLISLLLQFPDEDLVDGLKEVEAVVCEMKPESRSVFSDLLGYLRQTPLIHVQEEYTRIFDLNPSMCLNLTHHKPVDDREKSVALAALSNLYRAAGFEQSTGELPDFLPLILEFLSVCPEGAGRAITADYREEVHGLAARLKKVESRYAALLGLAAELFDGRADCER